LYEDQYFRRFARKSLAHVGQFAPIDQQYSHFKTEQTPWLSDVPSQLLRNGAVLWKQAYVRYFSKLAGRPAIHRKTGEQSVWLTSELFTFKPLADNATGEIVSYDLRKSFGWQHPGALVVDPRNPRYNAQRLAVGEFM
jgi:putative transposase